MAGRRVGFNIIAAVSAGLGLGTRQPIMGSLINRVRKSPSEKRNDTPPGDIPWRLSKDLKYFRDVTTGSGNNAVIMGKNTWHSLPDHAKPLKDRLNIVLSSEEQSTDHKKVFKNLDRALDWCRNQQLSSIWVIGGAQIYREAITHPDCDSLYLTEINRYYSQCDVHFPQWDHRHFIHDSSHDIPFEDVDKYIDTPVTGTFKRYIRHPNVDEMNYLDLMKKLLRNGKRTDNRTDTATYRLIGETLRFDLRNGTLPALTTKKVPLHMVFKELSWFLKGDTNVNHLREKGVHIWDANTTREELDKRGFNHLSEYSLPYGYGFLWRHFGAEYKTSETDYSGQGFDQIKYVIDEIKNNPTSRRIILSAWYPPALKKMVLPACHSFYIWSADRETRELDVTMIQRSGDFFLGNPFNICSTAMLTYMIGHMTGYTPRSFFYCIHDCHLYENHLDAARTQVKRDPMTFPKIQINPMREINDISDFQFEDLVISDYNHHPAITAPMAV